jgi:hypothetical protein
VGRCGHVAGDDDAWDARAAPIVGDDLICRREIDRAPEPRRVREQADLDEHTGELEVLLLPRRAILVVDSSHLPAVADDLGPHARAG